MIEPTPQQLSILGSKTSYWVYHPEGHKTILMLHGFRGNHAGLKYIIAGLNEYRVIVPDLPGFGESTPMSERRHDIAGYSDFAREFTNSIGINQPVLLGHSFGSIIAAHTAAHYPSLYSQLILINPVAVSPLTGISALPTKLVEAYYWLGTQGPDGWSDKILRSRTFSRLMSLSLSRTKDPDLRRLVYEHHLKDLNLPQHRKVVAQSFKASITKTALDDAALIHLETLLVGGELDPISNVKSQRRLNDAVKFSKLVLVPKVGHLIHLETPASAASAIKEFIA